MLFTEPAFIFVFLPIVLGIYYMLGLWNSLRNPLLLLASLLFYAWGEGLFVIAMILSIAFNYTVGAAISQQRRAGRQISRWPVTIGVLGNLAFLIVFKYADFLVSNLNMLFTTIGATAWTVNQPGIELPIGVSFFTFQAISFVIDMHRGDVDVELTPSELGLYIALFPQLIAGPIVRYKDIGMQIVARAVTPEGFAEGIRRFIMGLGKKMIIADTCARQADLIFGVAGDPNLPGVPFEQLACGLAWTAIVCYTLQIYFDFSGYSDMAIGLGLMFGFRFLENFNYPYISQSITEFWQRWHISLSRWFRDYLYIPLGGNRVSKWTTYRNLLIVFFLCGLWHGASWNFVIWGMIHGCFLVAERGGMSRILSQLYRPLRHVYVLLAVMIGWVFFRVETVEECFMFLSALIGRNSAMSIDVDQYLHFNRQLYLAIALGVACSTPWLPWFNQMWNKLFRPSPSRRGVFLQAIPQLIAQVMLVLILLLCMMLIAGGSYSPFIYYRF